MAEEVQAGNGPENELGRLIYVYRNGDRFKNYKRYVVNRKTVRSLDYLFNELTKLLQPSFGAVRNIRTPTHGHVVNSLDEIEGGHSYVAGGHGKFIRLPYEKARSVSEFCVPGKIKRSAEPYGAPKPVQIKPVKHSRIVASGRVKKDPGDCFFLYIYVNGDDLTSATKVRLVAAERSSIVAALNAIGKKVHTLTGAVLRIYTLTGERIRLVEELQNGESYVAVGREKQFRAVEYGKHLLPVWHPGKHVDALPVETNTIDKLSESSSHLAVTTTDNRRTHIRRPVESYESRLSNQRRGNSNQRGSNYGSTMSLQEKEPTQTHAGNQQGAVGKTEQTEKSKKPPEPESQPPPAKGRGKKDKDDEPSSKHNADVTPRRTDQEHTSRKAEVDNGDKKERENQSNADNSARKNEPKKQQPEKKPEPEKNTPRAPPSNDSKKPSSPVHDAEKSKEHSRISEKKQDHLLNPEKKENVPSRSGTHVVQGEDETHHGSQAHHDGNAHNADSSKPRHDESTAHHRSDREYSDDVPGHGNVMESSVHHSTEGSHEKQKYDD